MKFYLLFCLLIINIFSFAEPLKSPDDFLKKAKKCEQTNPEQAYKYYSEALRYSDNSWKKRADCYFKRGELFFAFQNYPKALADFSQVVQLDKENYLARKQAAHCFFMMKEAAKALQQIETAIAINDKDHEIFFLKGKIYLMVFQSTADNTENRLINSSIEALNIAIDLKKKYPEAYYLRGRANMITNQLEEALKDFQKAVKYEEKMAPAWLELARTYIALEQNINAIGALEKCVKINPQFFPAYSMLYEGYISREFFDKLPALAEQIENNLPLDHPAVGELVKKIKQRNPENVIADPPKEVAAQHTVTNPPPAATETKQEKPVEQPPIKENLSPPKVIQKIDKTISPAGKNEPEFSDNWY